MIDASNARRWRWGITTAVFSHSSRIAMFGAGRWDIDPMTLALAMRSFVSADWPCVDSKLINERNTLRSIR